METSPLTSRVNQWIGFYMLVTSVMKELNTKCFYSFIIDAFYMRQCNFNPYLDLDYINLLF